jgi:hypothetical protein
VTNEPGEIIDGKYIPRPLTDEASIRYLLHKHIPVFIARRFSFVELGTTEGENAVMGACGITYNGSSRGFGTGSIQMQVFHSGWSIFVVENPIVDPYPDLISGTFDKRLEDGKEYSMLMEYDPLTSSITVIAPDGTVGTVTDARISEYWGPLVGTQCRRPNATDGYVAFHNLVDGPPISYPTPSPVFGSLLNVPGDSDSYVSTKLTTAYTPGDLDLIGQVMLDSYTSGTNQVEMQQWDAANDQRVYRVEFDGAAAQNGKIHLRLSFDGIANEFASSTVVFPGVVGVPIWYRIARVGATGVVTFYYSNDSPSIPIANITWTALGATVATTVGDPFAGTMLVEVGLSAPGRRAVAQIKNDGTTIATYDTRGLWSGVDAQGNVWVVQGTDAAWQYSEANVATTKGADQSVISTTTLVAVTGLSAPIAASESREVTFYLYIDGDATADMRVVPVIPAGATMEWWTTGGSVAIAAAGTGTGNWEYGDETTTYIAIGTSGVGTKTVARVHCRVHNSTTAGTVTLKFAQNISTAVNTTIYARSQVESRKIS